MGLSVDADIALDMDLLGKTVSDLQSDIVIDDDSITGTLLYVDDYTGFSGDVSLQSGNYVVVHAEVPDVEDVTITATISNTVTLDDDGILIGRIADKDSQTITFVASKEGCESVTKVFDLSGLTCNEE